MTHDPNAFDGTDGPDLAPDLQILFANAERDLPDTGFTEALIARMEQRHRRRRALMIGIPPLLALLGWLAGVPALDFAVALSQGLMAPLSTGVTIASDDAGSGLLNLLAPVNQAAGLIALGLVLLQLLLRRL